MVWKKEKARGRSQYFFSYVKNKSKVKTKIGPLFNSEGKLTAKSKEMAELLSQQYVNVFSKPSTDHISNNNNPQINSISPIEITEELFIKAIDELSQTAAPGPDGFPAILLKKLQNCPGHTFSHTMEEKHRKGCSSRSSKKINYHSNPQRR